MQKFIDTFKALSAEKKQELAERSGTSINYLRLICYSDRKPGPELAKQIFAAMAEMGIKNITLADIRPDIWG